MYYIINQVLIKKPTSIISQSIHLSQCIKKKVINQENDKENYENESDYQYNKFKISQPTGIPKKQSQGLISQSPAETINPKIK